MSAIMTRWEPSPTARAALRLAGATGSVLAGCVQVAAPDRPIEVNLNINIRQEVVVRLQQDARELIQREQKDY